MAKPISFTKRDLEKKKQEKRLAKPQKKEERKSNGTSSFEDMIAYVDENGMITSGSSCFSVCNDSSRRNFSVL